MLVISLRTQTLEETLEVGRKPSLLSGFVYISNLTIIPVYKIGLLGFLHVIVMLL